MKSFSKENFLKIAMIFSKLDGLHEYIGFTLIFEVVNLLLENKTAVIYGAGGAVGEAVARAFAKEGAKVFLTGHTLEKVNAIKEEITAAGGEAYAAQVDALNKQEVENHL